ncbi:hypothetical protein BIPXVNHO_CDS0143 [Staphylococcus phage PG-2021_27]
MTKKYKDLDNFLPNGDERLDDIDLVESLDLQNINKSVGNDNFSFLIEIANALSDDNTLRFWSILDFLLNENIPTQKYKGIYRDLESKETEISNTSDLLANVRLETKVLDFVSQFDNLKESFYLSYLFTILYKLYYKAIDLELTRKSDYEIVNVEFNKLMLGIADIFDFELDSSLNVQDLEYLIQGIYSVFQYDNDHFAESVREIYGLDSNVKYDNNLDFYNDLCDFCKYVANQI